MSTGTSIALATVSLAFALTLFVAVAIYGSNLSEINECQKWHLQASTIDGFFLAQWQKDECDAHHITINAPVK